MGWWTLAILHAERMQGSGESGWVDDLAMACLNRGSARHSGGNLAGAVVDYDRAITLLEELRTRLEPTGEWLSAWANHLAKAYVNRGAIRYAVGDLVGALSNCDQSIDIREALRARLEPSGEWPQELANDLAKAYVNRSQMRQSSHWVMVGVIGDCDQAIVLMEWLQARLEPSGEWPQEFANDLANAYVNRSSMRIRYGGDLVGAMTDCDRAIELGEALRKMAPQGEWSPRWAIDLAKAYVNRSLLCDTKGSDIARAADDCFRSIVIIEAVKAQLKLAKEWPPEWAYTLAQAYFNRGNRLYSSGYLAGAMGDFDQAIALLEELRAQLEQIGEWQPQWSSSLINAYCKRGGVRSASDDLAGALADYDRAIELGEALRVQLVPRGQWLPEYAIDLAKIYINQGLDQNQTGHLAKAFASWDRAAIIFRALVEQGLLPMGTNLLEVVTYLFLGHCELIDWLAAARFLLAFLDFHLQLEDRWAKRYNEIEPPWRDIVGQFANAIHGLNPDQRAALLEALGENAEVVKQVFGWT